MYDTLNGEAHWHKIIWTMKYGTEQWNHETLEGLSKGVKHTKWPSALAYDEMNIHVIRGEIMKRKCSKVNECGDNMIRD